MKYFFGILLISLIIASSFTFFSFSEKNKEVPVLHWVTGYNEPRVIQTELFEQWMVENGYPAVDLRIDTRGKNQDLKNVVQGVSGVAGDIFECYAGGMNLYHSVGMLEDLTDIAKEMGFDPSKTYKAVQPILSIDGHQYGFPRSVSTNFYWVNVETFEKAGISVPSLSWTFEEFEQKGRAFVQALNDPNKPQSIFFGREFTIGHRNIMLRSMGVDFFNETMTKSNWDHPLNRKVFEITYDWTFNARIIPTRAEALSLSSSTSTNVSHTDKHLFAKGELGLVWAGRWGLMSYRLIGPERLSISEFPNNGFRNTYVGAATMTVYKGSKQKELAMYFLKFMNSEVYNRDVIDNADGLPPIPHYALEEEFSYPSKYPNEWGLHDKIRDMGMTIAIASPYSPFVLRDTFNRHDKNAFEKFMANRTSAEEALKIASLEIEKAITLNVSKSKEMSQKYEKCLKDQEEIDRLRAAGKIVPLHLITNPFYRRYYVDQGWSLPEE
jgi:multiple sugar transport system substrate-binding protein